MLQNNSIEKELILPDAIELWERRWRDHTRLAKIFKFWRFRYLAIVTFLGTLLLFKNLAIGIIVLLLGFILDYLILRSRRKENFKVQLKELKELLCEGFYESDKHRKDPYEFGIGKNKIIDCNPANILRKAWISIIAERNFKLSFRILDAGCKGGEMSAMLSSSSNSIFGIDFNRSALINFVKRFKGSGVQANILNLPFKRKKFDAALCTEVIEHLFDPVQGINEIADAIKTEGILILSTDNRNRIRLMEIFNPLIIIERIIGLVFQKALPPKNLIWKWKEDFKIFHTEFSRVELISLVNITEKFEIISHFSLSFFPGLYRIINRINSNLTEEDYLKLLFPIEKILVKIPIIRWLGDHWIMVLRKV